MSTLFFSIMPASIKLITYLHSVILLLLADHVIAIRLAAFDLIFLPTALENTVEIYYKVCYTRYSDCCCI